MKNRHGLSCILAVLLLAALLLTACGTGVSPAEPEETAAPTQAEELPEGAVRVSTVDELLAAIAPNAVIVLQEGEYDLSKASDYGVEDLSGPYHWELVYGGCGLVLSHVPGLRLIGQGEVSILAQPRYAEVITFRESWDLSLEGLTLGHVQAPGGCSAGVLSFSDCDDVRVDNCRLFGCGSMGITATNCQSLAVRGSQIDSCSDGAVTAFGCRDLRLEDCKLCDCGLGQDFPAGNLIYTERCVGLALVNCQITGNRVNQILLNQWSDQVALLGCRVADNRVLGSYFQFTGRSVTVDKCSFQRRSSERYYPQDGTLFALDPAGEELISFDLDHMELARAEYDGPAEREPVRPERTELPDGGVEVRVSNTEELLAAIAPNTTIVLEAGTYDLSNAVGYGREDGDWYTWDPVFDGFCLKLTDVQNLTIQGAGMEETLITVSPRYAAVFSFQNCENLRVSGLTAGHSEAPGYCAGNVLDFDSCRNVSLEDCGLFGCGVMGIWAWNCQDFAVRDSRIYECSSAAAQIESCLNVSFDGCSIYDCDEGNDVIYVLNGSIAWNGEELTEGAHRFDRESYLGALNAEW